MVYFRDIPCDGREGGPKEVTKRRPWLHRVLGDAYDCNDSNVRLAKEQVLT